MRAPPLLEAGNPALAAAFIATSYRVEGPDGPIELRIGRPSRLLDRLLKRKCMRYWAFITACNPGSRPLPGWRNATRMRQLAQVTTTWGFRTLPADGVGDDQAWGSEPSLLILGIPPARALRLGRQFGQCAIVVGSVGVSPQLLWCKEGEHVGNSPNRS